MKKQENFERKENGGKSSESSTFFFSATIEIFYDFLEQKNVIKFEIIFPDVSTNNDNRKNLKSRVNYGKCHVPIVKFPKFPSRQNH